LSLWPSRSSAFGLVAGTISGIVGFGSSIMSMPVLRIPMKRSRLLMERIDARVGHGDAVGRADGGVIALPRRRVCATISRDKPAEVTTMMVLYGTQGSGAAAIDAALRMTGGAYRVVEAASWKPGPGQDELRRVNPLAQIPTLVLEDGSVMSESAAILIYLGERYPASGLLPEAPAARAQSLRGLVYIAANCYAAIGIIDFPERAVPGADDALKERIVAGTRARLHELWDTFADAFPATPFLAGPRVGALDLLACVVSRWSGARKHLATTRPAFHALLLRIEEDPLVAAVFAQYFPPPKAAG